MLERTLKPSDLKTTEIKLTDGDHPIRRAILDLLRERELSAGDIARLLELRRPALSHHLAILLLREVVICRAQGAFRFYSLPKSFEPTEKHATPRPTRTQVETPFTAAFRRLAREKGVEQLVRAAQPGDA